MKVEMFAVKLKPLETQIFTPYSFPWYEAAIDPFGYSIQEGDILGFFRNPRGILFETQFFLAYYLNAEGDYVQTPIFREVLRIKQNPFTKKAFTDSQKDILLRRATYSPPRNYEFNNSNNNINIKNDTKSFNSTHSIHTATMGNNEELIFPMNGSGIRLTKRQNPRRRQTSSKKTRMLHHWFFTHSKRSTKRRQTR